MKIFLCFCLLILSLPAFGQTRITASITVTNATTNGMTFTVNGNVRTFTNQVFQAGSQVLTNSDATGAGSKTNLLNQISLNPFSQVTPANTGSNTFQLSSPCGVALIVSASAGYANVSYSTQLCSFATPVGIPFSAYYAPLATRTNTASQLIKDLNDYATNSIDQTKPIVSQLVGTNNTQVIAGQKTFNNAANSFFGNLYGNLFDAGQVPMIGRSGGNTVISDTNSASRIILNVSTTTIFGGSSLQGITLGPSYCIFGGTGTVGNFYTDASATKINDPHGTNRFLADATSTGLNNSAGNPAFSTALDGTRIYDQSANVQIAINTNNVTLTNATVVGNASVGGNVSAGGSLIVTGGAAISGAQTNGTFTGTNTFLTGADIAFVRKSVSSLANGNNAAVPIGTNVFIEVSGPSGSFAINGIANGRDGKLITVLNQTGFQMTIANESGTDPTAANRIRTLGAVADVVLTNAACSFIYNANVSRWILISHNP